MDEPFINMATSIASHIPHQSAIMPINTYKSPLLMFTISEMSEKIVARCSFENSLCKRVSEPVISIPKTKFEKGKIKGEATEFMAIPKVLVTTSIPTTAGRVFLKPKRLRTEPENQKLMTPKTCRSIRAKVIAHKGIKLLKKATSKRYKTSPAP